MNTAGLTLKLSDKNKHKYAKHCSKADSEYVNDVVYKTPQQKELQLQV